MGNGLCGALSPTTLPSRFDLEQVAHEEVHSSAISVGLFRDAMTSARHDQQVEILVGLDQRVDDLHG